MFKKKIYAITLALVVPIISYLLLKIETDELIGLPQKYFVDSVRVKEKNGKLINDTIWHKTANFKLINQLGDTVELYQLKGKAIVFDIFFTRCGSICPRLTDNMAKLQNSFTKGGNVRKKIDTSLVHFISLSIDPEDDSVPVLKQYADRFKVNPDNWWMLTGNKDSIYKFIFEELKIDKISDEPITPEFPHSGRFVLLDKNFVVRGRFDQPYNGLNDTALQVLARDIGLLVVEKDSSKPTNAIFAKILNLWWLWLIIGIIILIFSSYLAKTKNRYP